MRIVYKLQFCMFIKSTNYKIQETQQTARTICANAMACWPPKTRPSRPNLVLR